MEASADTGLQEVSLATARACEERIQIVRKFYQEKGYRVCSGFQFGCELVLYADDPSRVHSDYCVHVVPEGKLPYRIFPVLVEIHLPLMSQYPLFAIAPVTQTAYWIGA